MTVHKQLLVMLHDRASIEIAAPANRIYDLVADVTNTGDLSPECRRVEWVGDSDSPVVGARFRGHNRWRGFRWWRQVKILQAQRGHEFVFETVPGRGIYNDATTWRYQFEPSGDGMTRVTESYIHRAPQWLLTMDKLLGRRKALRRGMRYTLAKLKQAAEMQ